MKQKIQQRTNKRKKTTIQFKNLLAVLEILKNLEI